MSSLPPLAVGVEAAAVAALAAAPRCWPLGSHEGQAARACRHYPPSSGPAPTIITCLFCGLASSILACMLVI